MSGGRRGLHWQIKLPEDTPSSTAYTPRKTHKVPHNKEVIVISSDGEDDQPSISPKRLRASQPLAQQDSNTTASSSNAIRTTTLPSHFLTDTAPPRLDLQSTTGREGRRRRAQRQDLDGIPTTSEAASLCDSAGMPVLQTPHRRSSSDDNFLNAMVNSGASRAANISTALDSSLAGPSSSASHMNVKQSLGGDDQPALFTSRDETDNSPDEKKTASTDDDEDSNTGFFGHLSKLGRRHKGRAKQVFQSLVGERLGGPSAEAAASSSLATNLSYSSLDSSSSASAAGPSSTPSTPEASAIRACKGLLDVHPSTDAPAVATTHTIKIDKLARSATTGITAHLSVNGRVVGRASGQAASKEAQTTALNELQDDTHGKRFMRNLTLESNRIGGHLEDLDARGNELWSLIFVRAACRSGIRLALGQNFMAYVNKNYGVPIRLNVVHRWIFDRPNSLRPPFDRVSLEALAPPDAEFVKSAGHERKGISPERMRASVPPSFAKLIGLGPVSVSTAATPRNGYRAPATSDMIWHPICRDRRRRDYHSSNFIINHHDVREKVPDLFAFKLLGDAVAHHVEATAAGRAFDAQAYIDERAYDPPNPAKLPAFFWRRGVAVIKVDNEAAFSDFEAFIAAREKLMDIIWELQERHGRQWVIDHWKQINNAWYDPLVKAEILADQEWASNYNRTAFVNAAAASGHASICRGKVSYGALGHFHPADHVFAPGELYDGLCLRHYLVRRFQEVRDNWDQGYARLMNYVHYDARRGHQLKAGDVSKVASTAGRLLFAPAQLDLAAMRACLGETNDSAALLHKWSAMLGNVVPGLDLELLSTRPRQDRVPVHHRLLQVARRLVASLDLTRQFDALGRIAGHATAGCVALVPSWFQRRCTAHPAVAGLLLTAVQLQRVGSAATAKALDQIADILEAIYPVALEYGKAGKTAAGLSPSQVELDEILHDLVSDKAGSKVGWEQRLEGLRATVASMKRPRSDALAHADMYSYKADRLRALAASGDDDGDAAGDADAARLAENLEAAVDEASSMDEAKKAKLIEHFKRVGDMIQRLYPGGHKLRFNKEGLPIAFLPESTSSEEAFELAAKSWLRANDVCDRVIQDKLGIIVWEKDDWWRVLICWMIHYVRYGDRCAVTGLRFDLTGRPYHPCAPTLLAHRDHAARFLDGTQGLKLASLTDEGLRRLAGSNAVVQTWLLNKLIASDHISWILATLQHSRPGCAELARRLVVGGLLDLSPADIDALTQGPPLAPNTVTLLLENGGGGGEDAPQIEDEDE